MFLSSFLPSTAEIKCLINALLLLWLLLYHHRHRCQLLMWVLEKEESVEEGEVVTDSHHSVGDCVSARRTDDTMDLL